MSFLCLSKFSLWYFLFPLIPLRIFLAYFFCMFIRISVSSTVSNWFFQRLIFTLFLFIVNEYQVFFIIFDIYANLYSIIHSIIIHNYSLLYMQYCLFYLPILSSLNLLILLTLTIFILPQTKAESDGYRSIMYRIADK